MHCQQNLDGHFTNRQKLFLSLSVLSKLKCAYFPEFTLPVECLDVNFSAWENLHLINENKASLELQTEKRDFTQDSRQDQPTCLDSRIGRG